MTKYKVVIIEDEKPASRLLVSMLSKIRPLWSVQVISDSVAGAIRWFNENDTPDLLFLDIQLSDGNSFTFLEDQKPTCPIIFTTAYDEYAIEAFKVNSIDYLLKPFDESRLTEAIVKFESSNSSYLSSEAIINALRSLSTDNKKYRTRFLISGCNDRFETLQVEDIAYFYSVNRISFAVCKDNKERVINLSLDRLSEQLDPDRFFRANRQFILNIDAVRHIETYFGGKLTVIVEPKSSEKILVSREKATAFRQWLDY